MEILDKQGLIEYDKKIKNAFKKTAQSALPNGILHINTAEETKILDAALLTDADTLGGQAPEYYATAQEIAELDNQIKTQYVSNNTSVQNNSPDTPGWYRIARYGTPYATAIDGGTAFGCDLVLRMGFGYTNNSCHHIKFISAYGNFHFIPIADITNTQTLTKIRLCKTPEEGYIEVFYNREVPNNLNVTISNAKDYHGYWHAIRPEFTEESAEGCTYYAVTDIPANYIPYETYSNPNILINSDFRNPINQRGQTEYTGNNIYTVDRWRTGGGGANGKIIINDGYVTIERTNASLYLSLFQKIAAEDVAYLSKQTVTLSAKVRTNSNYFRLSINVNDGTELNYDTFDGTGDWQIITKTVILPQLDSYINLGLSNSPAAPISDSCDIAWIKLELGASPTLYIPSDPVAELMKCQTYYRPIINHALRGMMISDTIANVFMNFPAMRVVPTVLWNNIRLTIAGVGNISSFTTAPSIRNGCAVFSLKTAETYEKYQSCSITVSDGDIVGYLDAEIY